MRIVLLVYRYWPVVGGVEKYIHQLARSLQSAGHRVDVIAGATVEDLPESETHEGVPIHRFPALRSPLRSRAWFIRKLPLLARADVINVSNTHVLEYFWRMIGPMVDRRKVFLTRHGMSYTHPVPRQEKRRAKRSLKLAAGVVHDGEFIEKWLEVKPNICPDQGLHPQADDLTPVPEPPPESAVYIGRIEPDSGIGMYIDAVRILAKRWGRPFELQVFGDGTLARPLSEAAEREELPIRFNGREEDAQRHIVESCFAFIDGRMAIQEAMARRRLVVAAYTDPLKKDYIGGEPFSPYLVMAGDGEELARKVAHHIDHPDQRADLISRAFDHARTLSWTKTAEGYLELWRRKLARPQPRCSRWELTRMAHTIDRESRIPAPAR